MADYLDLQTIAGDSAFQGRCRYALVITATFNMNNTQNISPQLVAFCNQAIAGQVSGYQLAMVVLSAANVAAEATTESLPGCTAVPDTDIIAAVDTYLNAMAGIATFPAS
jgi:hypothetical protein